MKTQSSLAAARLASCLLLVAAASHTLADVVYLTARPPLGGNGTNPDLNGNSENVYTEDNLTLDNTSAKSAAYSSARTGSRYYQFSAPMTNTTSGFTIRPDLGVPGGIYLLDHSLNPNAGNVNTNAIFSVSSTNATLSVSETAVFQNSAGNTWKTIGYVTNAPGSSNPAIQFRYQSGYISAADPDGAGPLSGKRLLVDVFRFSFLEPCLSVPVPTVRGPIATNLPALTVAGVTNTATAVAIYQDSGSGMVKIGELTSGVVSNVNLVPVTGLVKNARVSATQTVGGQESCVQASGPLVGGGANPRIRVALSIRETSSTGPVGTPAGDLSSINIHFLGSTFRTNAAPGDGTVVNPSTAWQTLTFDADPQLVLGNAANVVGPINDFGSYAADTVVQVRVYAFTNDPVTFINYYSLAGATSATVTSNGTFGVDWAWDAVPGAQGYRLLRSTNSSAFNEYYDVYEVTTLQDLSFGWTTGAVVTPAILQSGPSVQWNGTPDLTNNIGTPWGVLDAIAIAIDDLTDTGPFDIYLDNLQNGATVFQDFEAAVAGAQDFAFRAPGFSGSTSGFLLGSPNPAPNDAIVSNGAADTGTKSLRVGFQWAGTNAGQWLRLTTSGVGNPQVNLFEPISLRMLLLPVNATPVAPPAPSLEIALINGEAVLTWTGAHRLLESTNVAGPYTAVAGPITLGPFTNPPAGDAKFFRLVD